MQKKRRGKAFRRKGEGVVCIRCQDREHGRSQRRRAVEGEFGEKRGPSRRARSMSSTPTTAAERTLFQLIYVLPWSTISIVAILIAWKPEQLVYHLQSHADSVGVNIRTLIVFSLLSVVGIILVVIAGVKLYTYIRDNKEDDGEALRIYEKERTALIALFNSLDGKKWFNKIRWCSDEPIDRWHGVKLDPVTRRVNKIILPENELAGELPEEIGHLECLIELDLRRNNIGGKLPKALLSLQRMEGLYLFENRFEGEIPMALCELPNLMGIYLFNNNFDNSAEAAKLFREKLPAECQVFI